MLRGNVSPRPHRPNIKRIGKKTMSIYRTSALLEKKSVQNKPRRTLRLPSWRPSRRQYIIATTILVFGLMSSGAYLYWRGEQDKASRAAERAQQERARQASIKSNECRKQKLAAKADQLGKITYDELYDYTVCDYSGQ
ncbi:hypothetical protein IPM09_01120 [Candidatus Saccharibacteria bacterium]|nr:MAG: hypothetical protein IPM09_01120 [Candidatus Saccharibacteria bacterium]